MSAMISSNVPGGYQTPAPSAPGPPANTPVSILPNCRMATARYEPCRRPWACASNDCPGPCTESKISRSPLSRLSRPENCSVCLLLHKRTSNNVTRGQLVASSIVTIKSQCRPGTHSWSLPSWCSNIPGQAAGIAPRLAAFFTTCSLAYPTVTALPAVPPIPGMLHVPTVMAPPVAVSSTGATGKLGQRLSNNSVQPVFFIPITPEGGHTRPVTVPHLPVLTPLCPA